MMKTKKREKISKKSIVATSLISSNPKKFLDELFSGKPEETFINIWTLPNQKSSFFKDLDKASTYIDQIKTRPFDIYIQCGLLSKPLGSKRRGKKEDVVGLPGLYMDVDVADDAHKNKKLPPSIHAAIDLIKEIGIEPTLIVNSGHGLHVWWLFENVLIFDNDEARSAAEMMNRRLQETIKQRARGNGWDLDSTFEINRVLRVVGTYNRKDPGNPKLVKVVESSGTRYPGISKFDSHLIPENNLKSIKKIESRAQKTILKRLRVHNPAQISTEKLQELIQIEPIVKATYKGKRTDFAKNSPSEHALSLAHYAVSAGWTDQEICNLIVAFYKENKNNPNFPDIDPLKPVKRPEWVASTIAKARSSFPVEAEGKVSFHADCGDLMIANAKVFQAFNQTNDPPELFSVENSVARLICSDNDPPVIKMLDRSGIRFEIVRRAFTYREKKNDEGKVIKYPHFPSYPICEDILETPQPPLPRLLAICENPYYSAGFTMVTLKGYFAPAATFYHDATELIIPDVPGVPTEADIDKAKDLLINNLLQDFPFVSDSDRAHALSMLLIPFVRRLISGPTPLHAVTAPVSGSGKTLLTDIIITTVSGGSASRMAPPHSDAEWQKTIFAKLKELPSFIVIDNATEKLESSSFAAAITSDKYEGRILGESKMSRVPVRCCWIVTGNNLDFNDDMTRRTVPIRLDTGIPDPALRDPAQFKIPHIKKWALDNRPQLIWSVMVLVNNWKAAGMPNPRNIVTHLGMFEDYERVIGGILENNGINGFLANLHEFRRDYNQDSYKLLLFINAWYKEHKCDVVFATDLVEVIVKYQVPIDLGEGDIQQKSTRMGKYLEKVRNKRVGQYIVRRQERQIVGKTPYRLERSLKVVENKATGTVTPSRM